MRWIIWICLAAVAAAVQTTVAPEVQIGAVRPDYPFLLVVALGLTAPAARALFAAAIVGAFVDLSTQVPLGTFTFVYGMSGFLIVQVREMLFREALLSYVLVTLLCGLLSQSVIAVLRAVQDGAGQYQGSLVIEALSAALYTTVWSIPVHGLYLKCRRLLGLSPRRRLGYSRP